MSSRSPRRMEVFARYEQREVLVVDMEPQIDPEIQHFELVEEFVMVHEMQYEVYERDDRIAFGEEIGRLPAPDYQIQIEPEEQNPFEQIEEYNSYETEEPVEEIEMEEFRDADDERSEEELEEQTENARNAEVGHRERRSSGQPLSLKTKICTCLFFLGFFTTFFLVLGAVPALFVWLHLSNAACFFNICFITWVYGIMLVVYYGCALWHFIRCEISYLMYTYGAFWHLVFCVFLAEGLGGESILQTIGYTILGYAGFCLSYITLVLLMETAKRYAQNLRN